MSRRVWGLVVLLVVVAATWWLDSLGSDPEPAPRPTTTAAATSVPDGSGVTVDLPREAIDTIALVDAGGPFPYSRDGVVFENRERRLPQEPRGYYREYTVPTPGEDDRGARRLVEGRGGELYYSDDHYASFEQVRE